MAKSKSPKNARLIIGVIYRLKEVLDCAIFDLQKYGVVISKSRTIDFKHTKYYEDEMGVDLKRVLLVFDKLLPREELPLIKNYTNAIEKKLSVSGKRVINLDPGLMTLENFVLATCKGFSHRIYLGHGVYGDLTLLFKGDSYRTLEWTYPDYKEQELINFLNETRIEYKAMLQKDCNK